jgi:hypothetical protein
LAKPTKVDVFNRGLGVFLEWGPAQMVNLRDRIATAAPGLTGHEVGKLVAEFERLRSAACRIVEEQVEKHQAEEDGRRRVAELDERMSAKKREPVVSRGAVFGVARWVSVSAQSHE